MYPVCVYARASVCVFVCEGDVTDLEGREEHCFKISHGLGASRTDVLHQRCYRLEQVVVKGGISWVGTHSRQDSCESLNDLSRVWGDSGLYECNYTHESTHEVVILGVVGLAHEAEESCEERH